jgi:hypothetical protein
MHVACNVVHSANFMITHSTVNVSETVGYRLQPLQGFRMHNACVQLAGYKPLRCNTLDICIRHSKHHNAMPISKHIPMAHAVSCSPSPMVCSQHIPTSRLHVIAPTIGIDMTTHVMCHIRGCDHSTQTTHRCAQCDALSQSQGCGV